MSLREGVVDRQEMHWGLWGCGERDGAEAPAERGGGWSVPWYKDLRYTCTSRMLWAHAWREKHVCVQACGAPSGMAAVDGRTPRGSGRRRYVAAEPAARTVALTRCACPAFYKYMCSQGLSSLSS